MFKLKNPRGPDFFWLLGSKPLDVIKNVQFSSMLSHNEKKNTLVSLPFLNVITNLFFHFQESFIYLGDIWRLKPNQGHHGVAQRSHATLDIMKAKCIYGVANVKWGIMDKDLQVHTYKTNIILRSSLVQWDHGCASKFIFHNGTKFWMHFYRYLEYILA